MTPKGATAVIRWQDSPTEFGGYYFHFGEYPDKDEDDDDRIFYYAEGEEELKRLMQPGNGDFVIVSYQLEY